MQEMFYQSLNPHVVGRFFRVEISSTLLHRLRLNPHVVGRFFRVAEQRGIKFSFKTS